MSDTQDVIHKNQLDTPALCVDLDAMESNIRSLVKTCRSHQKGWRPHAKCHKCVAVGRKLVDAGAAGLTCAKLGEAEVFAAAGIRDLLIANMIVGSAKIARLLQLRKIADPIVCIDHIDQARPLSKSFANRLPNLPLRVIVEVDIGLNRVGTQPGEPTLELARQLHELPGLELAGIMGYEGHLLTIENPGEKGRQINAALDILADTKQQMLAAGLPCDIVSCGGTGSYLYSANHPEITELQAGGAIFMDEFYRHQCQVPELQYALTVISTIVSRPTPERAIIDAGRKTTNPNNYPPKVLKDGATVARLSAEHGELTLTGAAQSLRIGDRVEIVPGYGDMTIFLHNEMFATRGSYVEEVWQVDARGRLQ